MQVGTNIAYCHGLQPAIMSKKLQLPYDKHVHRIMGSCILAAASSAAGIFHIVQLCEFAGTRTCTFHGAPVSRLPKVLWIRLAQSKIRNTCRFVGHGFSCT